MSIQTLENTLINIKRLNFLSENKKKWFFNNQTSNKSQQKILFTINNPAIKQGDAEVEDINGESDHELEDDKNSV